MTTQFLDDVVQGHRVVQSLDVSDLPCGEHQLWFQASTCGIAQQQLLPVRVFKGTQSGPQLMITAGIHGDELNGVLAAQQVARELVGKSVFGCVTIVPTVNLTGMLNHSRDFITSAPDASSVNLNRFFPGNHDGSTAERFLANLWEKLLKPNATFAIDLHTQTSGAIYPLYAFADFRLPTAVEMARLMDPDCILDDPGDPGILETVWNRNGIPSITVEVGMGKVTQLDMIQRAVDGVINVLSHYQMITGTVKPPSRECVEGSKIVTVRAESGGFIIPQVALLDEVKPDQLLAIQYDAFGQESMRYLSPSHGVVLSHNTDAMREPGGLVVRLLS